VLAELAVSPLPRGGPARRSVCWSPLLTSSTKWSSPRPAYKRQNSDDHAAHRSSAAMASHGAHSRRSREPCMWTHQRTRTTPSLHRMPITVLRHRTHSAVYLFGGREGCSTRLTVPRDSDKARTRCCLPLSGHSPSGTLGRPVKRWRRTDHTASRMKWMMSRHPCVCFMREHGEQGPHAGSNAAHCADASTAITEAQINRARSDVQHAALGNSASAGGGGRGGACCLVDTQSLRCSV